MQPPLWLLKSWLMEAIVRTTVLLATFGFDVTANSETRVSPELFV